MKIAQRNIFVKQPEPGLALVQFNFRKWLWNLAGTFLSGGVPILGDQLASQFCQFPNQLLFGFGFIWELEESFRRHFSPKVLFQSRSEVFDTNSFVTTKPDKWKKCNKKNDFVDIGLVHSDRKENRQCKDHEVRVNIQDGDPWFVANDVCVFWESGCRMPVEGLMRTRWILSPSLIQ